MGECFEKIRSFSLNFLFADLSKLISILFTLLIIIFFKLATKTVLPAAEDWPNNLALVHSYVMLKTGTFKLYVVVIILVTSLFNYFIIVYTKKIIHSSLKNYLNLAKEEEKKQLLKQLEEVHEEKSAMQLRTTALKESLVVNRLPQFRMFQSSKLFINY